MSVSVPTSLLVAFLLATVRASAWIVVVPFFGNRTIPGMVKAALAMALAFPVAARLAPLAPKPQLIPMLGAILQNVAAGLVMGVVTLVLFSAVRAAGALLDYFGGFSLTLAFDPMSVQNDSIFARIYDLLAVTVLFASGAHLLMVKGLLESYTAVPVSAGDPLKIIANVVGADLGSFAVSSLEIAGPLLAVLVVADIGLGLLTKAAPALNVFSLGFPLKILVTLTLVGGSLVVLPAALGALVERILHDGGGAASFFSWGH
ncbi:MAG: flagellar biosynthetic protein FliR [Acidothermus sp.]|nr:flagellar biosynthetic protein FliR [Acidothermus sp.]MCL6538689.1 flagellar biosynthetic protein FliR [Acidothermus sp.]